MKIAMVAPRYPPEGGGVEMHVLHLARAFGRAGHQVDVLTQDFLPIGRPEAVIDAVGVSVRRFPIRIGGDAYPLAPSLWSYLRRRAGSYDVIHAHSFHNLAAAGSAFAPQRYVFTPHYIGTREAIGTRALHALYRPLGRTLLNKAAAVICTSGAEASLLIGDLGVRADRITVIPNGVDASAIRNAGPRPIKQPAIICASRLEPYKNLHSIVRALVLVPAPCHLYVLGEGSASHSLRELVWNLGLEARVTFVGRVDHPEIHTWLRSAAVFVSMSTRESFGLTLLEALAAGTPVVASDIPAHREVAESYGQGRVTLVPSCSPEALADQICASAQSPRAETWPHLPSWANHVDELMRIYERLRDSPREATA